MIVSAARTPTGKFGGALEEFAAPELGALVVAEAVRRAGIDPGSVDECILGNVISAGLGQNPARQAALRGGLSPSVAAVTINKVCGSGLKAVMLAAQGIATGDIEVAVAGGMESMSNAPYLLPRGRKGHPFSESDLVDAMRHDGLWCAYEDCHMGSLAELTAEESHVTREAQDAFALASHQKAVRATDSGWFSDEILPVRIGGRVLDRDEPIRRDTSLSALAALEPAFKNGGTVTAGNAPGVNDGASAVVMMSAERARQLAMAPLARIVGQATSGLPPRQVLMTPVAAIRRVLQRVDWTLADVDLFEINEAFAAQIVAVTRELELPEDKLNVHGGAIALGHALGSSGSRILITLIYALARRNLRRGIAALCLGGGNAVAVAVERD